jgi:hypothetical protein
LEKTSRQGRKGAKHAKEEKRRRKGLLYVGLSLFFKIHPVHNNLANNNPFPFFLFLFALFASFASLRGNLRVIRAAGAGEPSLLAIYRNEILI